MKIGTLFLVMFLIYSNISFGDGNSEINSFNLYVNSPEDNSEEVSVNKVVNPDQDHERHHKPKDNSEKFGTEESELQGIPAQWQTCTTDKDCTAGVADCMTWEALNKKYLNKLSKNLASCSVSIDPGFQPEAVCVAKVCKLTEKTTDVSWEEWLHAEKSL